MLKALGAIAGSMSKAAVRAMPTRIMRLYSHAAAMHKNIDFGHKKLLIKV